MARERPRIWSRYDTFYGAEQARREERFGPEIPGCWYWRVRWMPDPAWPDHPWALVVYRDRGEADAFDPRTGEVRNPEEDDQADGLGARLAETMEGLLSDDR